jgi:hypothetical protein
MKRLIKSSTILSARGAPSKLTKQRSTKRTETGEYHDPGDSYFRYEGSTDYTTTIYEGFIKDKQGNQYTVSAKYQQGDAGKIAGAGGNFYVAINYGSDVIKLESYRGVFDSGNPSGSKIIDSIDDGMYLEDYLQKFKWDIKGDRKLAEQIIEGNEYKETTMREDKRIADDARYVTHGKYGFQTRLKVNVEGDIITLTTESDRFSLQSETHKDYKIPVGTKVEADLTHYVHKLGNLLPYADGCIVETGSGGWKYDTKTGKLFQTQLDKIVKQISNLYILRDAEGNKPDTSDSKYGSIGLITYLKRRYEPTVKIVPESDKWNARLRAQGNDGINGPGWVTFPEALRQKGAEYRVDELIWNGKNYRIKGTPELIER